ncbi:hypothetical protein GCK32_012154 [Trichostrongylus colubriformis]|uniref:Uncharacterized protein n=1 Tax=Trichostrongylus colubriformis TaxID=6319 RepID=A0AAN8IH83_TRICO
MQSKTLLVLVAFMLPAARSQLAAVPIPVIPIPGLNGLADINKLVPQGSGNLLPNNLNNGLGLNGQNRQDSNVTTSRPQNNQNAQNQDHNNPPRDVSNTNPLGNLGKPDPQQQEYLRQWQSTLQGAVPNLMVMLGKTVGGALPNVSG